MGMRTSVAAFATAACALAAWACAGAAVAATPISPSVQVVLKPAQIGPGYRLHPPFSDCVADCVTLDLCGFSFPSEQLRTTRLQTVYTRSRTGMQLSNEVVTYRKGGAVQAMAELAYAITHCPKKAVRSTVRGVPPARYGLKVLKDSKLLPDTIALEIRMTGKVGKHVERSTVVAVYQIDGDVLSGVYSAAPKRFTAAQQIRFALHAAEASAANLTRFVGSATS